MLVEAAIIMPLLLLLVFGIIEYGLLYKDTSTVSAAAASGARTASTQARTSGYEVNAAAAVSGALSASGATPQQLIIYRVERNGSNQPVNWSNTQITGCTACYKFTWDTTNKRWNTPTGTWLWSAQQACGSTLLTDYVGVWVQARHGMITGMFGSARTITEKTVMPLEPVRQPCS